MIYVGFSRFFFWVFGYWMIIVGFDFLLYLYLDSSYGKQNLISPQNLSFSVSGLRHFEVILVFKYLWL